MTSRLAVAISLLAFAICLMAGGFQAGNPFVTTVWRAMLAMLFTLVIGLALGAIARRIPMENFKLNAKKLKDYSANSPAEDR